jgi:succinylarginine dihydrolase
MIGYHAFDGCTALTKLSLSPAVSIGSNCFSNCTALFTAAASQNMSTVKDLLNSRWHRILERVTVLSCLKTLFTDKDQPRRSDRLKRKRLDGDEVVALQGTAAFKRLPKVMWRVILEFL